MNTDTGELATPTDLTPCLVDPEVDTFGLLFGGLETSAADQFGYEELEVEWEPGDAGSLPDIFQHNFIRDYVFDDLALRTLRAVAGNDLKVIGTLRLGDRVLSAVRATPVLPVVDEARSIPSDFSWAKIGYPHIGEEHWESVARRVFHLPYPELATEVVVGAEVREACVRAGLTGWRFSPATVIE